jgi:hypothetical protein
MIEWSADGIPKAILSQLPSMEYPPNQPRGSFVLGLVISAIESGNDIGHGS